MYMQFRDLDVLKSETATVVPVDCPVCGIMLRESDIKGSYDKYGCCEECMHGFVHANKEKWLAGWRPTKTQVNRLLKKRAKLPSYIMRG